MSWHRVAMCEPADAGVRRRLLREADKGRANRCNAEHCDDRAAPHVWMAPAPQEILLRVEQLSLAVMCPACCCSPDGLLALMGSANRGLIIRTGSLSRRDARFVSVAADGRTMPSRVIALSQAPAQSAAQAAAAMRW